MAKDPPHVESSDELEFIAHTLSRQFADVDDATIDQLVRECATYFETAPVRSYLALLIEKRARDRLREAVRV